MSVSQRSLGMAIFGLILIAASIGAMYHIKLVIYGYFILLGGLLLSINYIYHAFMSSCENEVIGLKPNIVGLIGVLTLTLFFGIQSSHLPFKKYVLMAGIALMLPVMVNLLEGRK